MGMLTARTAKATAVSVPQAPAGRRASILLRSSEAVHPRLRRTSSNSAIGNCHLRQHAPKRRFERVESPVAIPAGWFGRRYKCGAGPRRTIDSAGALGTWRSAVWCRGPGIPEGPWSGPWAQRVARQWEGQVWVVPLRLVGSVAVASLPEVETSDVQACPVSEPGRWRPQASLADQPPRGRGVQRASQLVHVLGGLGHKRIAMHSESGVGGSRLEAAGLESSRPTSPAQGPTL
eukprot:6480713-Amphidinium_carterae.2